MTGGQRLFDAQDMKDLAFVANELAQPDTRPILRRKRLSERLLSLFRADFLGQTQWNPEKQLFEKPICYNRDQQMSWAYETYYQHCDPISVKIRGRPVATATYEIIPRRKLEGTEYYNDFLKPFKVSHGLDQYLYVEGRNIGDLRIWRKSAGHDFSARERGLLTALNPLLLNAYQSMLSGDQLEQSVSIAEFRVMAISADRRRHVCSPALLHWIADQPGLCEADVVATAKAAAISGLATFSGKRFRLRINRRNVSSQSQCAILCQVFPNADPTTRQALTRREKQVLRLVAEGQTDREIAKTLGISFWTVRSHVGSLLRKLDVRNRVGLAGHVRAGMHIGSE